MFRLRRRLGLWLTAVLLALMPRVAQASILDFIPTGPAGSPAQQQDKQAQFEGKFELAKVRILGVPTITVASPVQLGDPILRGIKRATALGVQMQVLLVTRAGEQWTTEREFQRRALRAVDPHAVSRGTSSAGPGNQGGLNNHKGTSPLQMQIGWFRLIQGAAYRSFRESYSANSETHLRAYDLPYTIPDFVRFVNAAVDFYLSLGIVEPGAEEPFERLKTSVNDVEEALRERMANWESISPTEAMLEAEGRLEQELAELDHHHQIVSVVLEVLLTAALHGHSPDQVTHEDLQSHELNRLRQLDDHREVTAELDHQKPASTRPYHDSWQRVIVDPDDERFAGSIMPTAYWYDEFMPLLLRASSVLSKDDISAWDNADDADLNAWFAERHAAGEFDLYGHATEGAFNSRPLEVKKELKRAWELTRHYLNGV